jgi:branched-chain amino acid transport system substrate-binding protein
MKKKLLFLSMATMLTTTIAMAGCTKGANSSSNGATVKIASVSPLSGSQAAIGESIKNGAKLALTERSDEFKKLNINLQFSPQDDQADPKVGVSVAQKLIADKDVLGVVGHYNSGVAIPSSEIYKNVNLAMVSPANTAVAVTERGYEDVNRICTRDDVQGPVAADFALSDLSAKTAFVIHDKTTYGQGVADEFKKRFADKGGTVAGYEGITAGESDFSGVLNKVAQVKPDVVYFGGMYPEGSLIIKQMKEKNITAKFIGPDGMDSAEVVKIAGDSSKGIYYTTMAADVSLTEEGRAWAEKYK